MSRPIAIEHLRELAARKSKTYELLIGLEQNPSADPSCFECVGRIVDRAVVNEISLDGAALQELAALVAAPADDLGSTLAVLDVALAEAEPDRGRLQLLLNGFSKWLKAASDTARPHFLSILPNIAACVSELGNAGVEGLIACFNACASAEEGEIVERCIARYQETSGEIIAASAEIGSLLVRTGDRVLVERFMGAAPPEAMLESKAARELLPALAKLKSAGAIGVCVAVAAHNHSSALNLARHLEGSLRAMDADMQVAYLKSFQSLVEEAGISLVGYGSKQLPGVFKKAGAERAAEFVAEGVGIAQRYGKVAAQEFFEKKTAAAEKASPVE